MIKDKRAALAKKSQRCSVSAEVYGIFNKKEDFVAPIIQKNEEQQNRIMNKVSKSFMFNALDEVEINTVILAFAERRFKQGETVINQGEQGDVLYLIESGTLDCYKTFDKDEGPKHLKIYEPGEAFGELALLYNAPRAATIIAKEDCILWALDRQTFNHIVKDAAM
jgi:cAMP-dependent protein kinase regulator